jgi:hypothetical protein
LDRRGAIAALAFAAAATALPAAGPTSPGDIAIAQLRETVVKGPRCEADKTALTYVGPTDARLTACLQAHPKAATLRITSLGGPVSDAIAAARIVAARAMNVEVAGFCGSSCGNYLIAAAARLDVLPDSVVMLHGAPLADPAAQREQAIAVLDQAGIPEDEENGAVLRSAMAQLQAQRALHDTFAADFAVGHEWYDLTAYYRAVQGEDDAPMLLVSPEFARACLGHPAIGTFWYPASDDERTRERQLLGGAAMFMGTDLPSPASCN